MTNSDLRIVAVDVRTESFGFTVFEGPSRILDWGVRSFRRGVNAVRIPAGEKFAWLLEYYKPDVLVLRIRPADTAPGDASCAKFFSSRLRNTGFAPGSSPVAA